MGATALRPDTRGMTPTGSCTETRRRTAYLTALIALVATLFAVLPNPASAATLVAADGSSASGPYQGWVDASALPTPAGAITVREGTGPCSSAACSTYAPATVWMGRHAGRQDLLHEIGHHFDAERMSSGARAAFTRLAGLGARPWKGGANPPNERFAAAYAMCGTSSSAPARTHWEYGYRPSVSEHRAVCGLIGQVGRE